MGLPVAEVELAVHRGGEEPIFGTVCRSVLQDDETLINVDELMAERGIRVSQHRRESYTIEAVFKALEDVEPPSSLTSDVTAWTAFIGYLTLDALIGNTDRHEENWSAVKTSRGRITTTPLEDIRSRVEYGVSVERRGQTTAAVDKRCQSHSEGYADRARTTVATRPHPIEALKDALAHRR